ncbi:LysR family transcriptional regulator ArgP [Halopseudomonas pelagia]|uniref:ArgP/LysG family DNA-binding transcriptional regulator n=1 Tax=Halopseudomonas pelagia TaxID=553151 RepID=A0AA91Z4C0_9GAMM|nr:LysR family transcriptional regulator ArgP [Halopseudomonas pelagia]PCC97501.1 ArgP/LysG family DNA-binding transcriptional regulator [Halopseudomonas pelagia]QFY57816.1 LysR family transcriptional regulator ArgP [Halopseudomonas pelagia]
MDYKLLQALAAVVEQGGFERAALTLGLSQSAVSQRIKLLESRVGAPVLLRKAPPVPTPAGQRLLNHMQQVRLLERDLLQDVPMGEQGGWQTRLRIALNADSLATWWAAAVAPLCEQQGLLLDLLTDDQEVGLRRMRSGEVAGCVCATPTPVAGARALKLGDMRYLAVARSDLLATYFPPGWEAPAWGQAPAIVFGPDDQLQHRFLANCGYQGEFPYHLCPSSEGFVRMLCAGIGWGMVPGLQIIQELEQGLLREILPGQGVEVPLYWHYWRNGGRLLEQLTQQLASSAPGLLGKGQVSSLPS